MKTTFSFDMIQSGLFIAALFVAGEWVSRRLKAAVPAFLAAGVLFALLMWSGFLPPDLVERSGLNSLITVGILFVILSMGSTTNFRQLAASWRVVVLAALAYAFELAVLFLVLPPLFGKNLAVAAIPGGSPVAFIVQQRARSLGYDDCVVLSVLLLSTQGLVGCPIVSFFVRRETSRLLREGMPVHAVRDLGPGMRDSDPNDRTESSFVAFFKLYIGAWMADRLASLTGIPVYVLCLLFGVILAELGFFRRDQLNATGSGGFFLFILMSVVLSGFSAASPAMLKRMLLPLVCILALDTVSLTLSSLLLGRILGFSPWMSVALGFNIMIGFPPNMIISRDIIHFLTDDPDTRALLMERIATPMVIAGFCSTTFLANIMAGFLVSFMV